MPDRIVRAKILTSDAVNALSWGAEVFYRRLMSIVDDFGRYDARTTVLRGSLYSLQLDKVSDADIVKWLGECSKTGLVSVYQVEGKEYLEVLKFGQRLRAMKSQYPPPENGKPLSADNIRGHLTANDRHPPPEEKRREENIETKEKGSDVKYSLSHCKFIALQDERWVKANKTNESELLAFNALLERRGHYEKNPADYKSHFANWKDSGKKDSAIGKNEIPDHKKSSGGPVLEKL